MVATGHIGTGTVFNSESPPNCPLRYRCNVYPTTGGRRAHRRAARPAPAACHAKAETATQTPFAVYVVVLALCLKLKANPV